MVNAAVSETVMPRFKSERPNVMNRDSSNGEDGSLIRSRRLFDSTIADRIRVAQWTERTPPKRENARSSRAANMETSMKTTMTKCSICKMDKPCIQRRDASWACGPCLQEEWRSVKRVLVQRSAAMAMGIRKRRSK